MERFQSGQPALQKTEFSPSQLLYYARKLFPVNVLVNIIGRRGIYRVVSEPYILPGYRYPHFDVEAFGERFCASVLDAARL